MFLPVFDNIDIKKGAFMAVIEERENKSGGKSYRVKIRMKGYPVQTATFQRKTDAKHWAQNTESAIREGRYFTHTVSKQKLFGEFIDRYIEEILPLKPKSQYDQTIQLRYWKRAMGHMRMEEVTTSVVHTVRNRLLEGKTPRGRGRSNATINRYMAALSHAYTVAINEWEWATDNPCKRISRLPESKGRARYLNDVERERLLDACKASENKYLHTIVVMALSTGARRNEIVWLKWDDVHFERQVLILTDTKNRETRTVPIQSYALMLLQKRYKNRKRGQSYVFPSHIKLDKPIDIEKAWQTALRRAQINDFRFHDLRHTAASYMAMNGASLKEIGDILGHKTVQMTQRYAHLCEAHTKQIVAAMNNKFFACEIREESRYKI